MHARCIYIAGGIYIVGEYMYISGGIYIVGGHMYISGGIYIPGGIYITIYMLEVYTQYIYMHSRIGCALSKSQAETKTDPVFNHLDPPETVVW